MNGFFVSSMPMMSVQVVNPPAAHYFDESMDEEEDPDDDDEEEDVDVTAVLFAQDRTRFYLACESNDLDLMKKIAKKYTDYPEYLQRLANWENDDVNNYFFSKINISHILTSNIYPPFM